MTFTHVSAAAGAALLGGFAVLQAAAGDSPVCFFYYAASAGCVLTIGFENRYTRLGTVIGCALMLTGLAAGMALVPSLFRLAEAQSILGEWQATLLHGAPAHKAFGLLLSAAILAGVLALRSAARRRPAQVIKRS